MAKLTNEQKYNTAEERVKACTEFLKTHKEYDKVPYIEAAFSWLTLEAEVEKSEPCPFCGGKVHLDDNGPILFYIRCNCGYRSRDCTRRDIAISYHNRLYRAVMAANGGLICL